MIKKRPTDFLISSIIECCEKLDHHFMFVRANLSTLDDEGSICDETGACICKPGLLGEKCQGKLKPLNKFTICKFLEEQ